MMESDKLREKLDQFLSGNLSSKPKGDDKKSKKLKRRGKNAVAKLETLIE